MHGIVCFFILSCLFLSGCGQKSGDSRQPPSQPSRAEEVDNSPSVSDPLRRKTSDVSIGYQNDLYTLLVSEVPKYTEICKISRDLQIASVHRRDMRYEYLWKNDRDRINTNGSFNDWLNFDWTEEDDKLLLAQSPRYGKLLDRIDELTKKNQGHPMWPVVVMNSRNSEMPVA